MSVKIPRPQKAETGADTEQPIRVSSMVSIGWKVLRARKEQHKPADCPECKLAADIPKTPAVPQIWLWKLGESDVSNSSKHVMGGFISFATQQTGWLVFASVASIARRAGVKQHTAIQAIQEWLHAGYLVIERSAHGANRGTNCYRATVPTQDAPAGNMEESPSCPGGQLQVVQADNSKLSQTASQVVQGDIRSNELGRNTEKESSEAMQQHQDQDAAASATSSNPSPPSGPPSAEPGASEPGSEEPGAEDLDSEPGASDSGEEEEPRCLEHDEGPVDDCDACIDVFTWILDTKVLRKYSVDRPLLRKLVKELGPGTIDAFHNDNPLAWERLMNSVDGARKSPVGLFGRVLKNEINSPAITPWHLWGKKAGKPVYLGKTIESAHRPRNVIQGQEWIDEDEHWARLDELEANAAPDPEPAADLTPEEVEKNRAEEEASPDPDPVVVPPPEETPEAVEPDPEPEPEATWYKWTCPEVVPARRRRRKKPVSFTGETQVCVSPDYDPEYLWLDEDEHRAALAQENSDPGPDWINQVVTGSARSSMVNRLQIYITGPDLYGWPQCWSRSPRKDSVPWYVASDFDLEFIAKNQDAIDAQIERGQAALAKAGGAE